jgi:uncharacterized protein (DUF433 family)
MTNSKSYVRIDENGAYRVGKTRVSLDSVVHAYMQGHSAEAIADQFPAITLEEAYGAIAFFLGNREEVERYLERQRKLWEAMKAEADAHPSPVVERIRALKAGVPQEKS